MTVMAFLVPVMIVILLIVGIRSVVSPKSSTQSATHSIKHLFQFGILYGLVALSALGISGILGRILSNEKSLVGNQLALARNVSFIVVGLPLLLLITSWIRKAFKKSPDESNSFGWQFYLTAMSLTALLNWAFSLLGILNWAFDRNVYSGYNVANLIIWSAIWVIHLNLDIGKGKRFTSQHSTFHYLAGCLIGLVLLAVGLVIVLENIFQTLFAAVPSPYSIFNSNRAIRGFSPIIVGLIIWFIYWLRTTLHSERNAIWNIYVLIFGVGGGFVATDIGAIAIVDHFLNWNWGDRASRSWDNYLQGYSIFLAIGLVGLLVWSYHKYILSKKTGITRSEVDRVYDYLISGLALITMSVGIVMVLVTFLEKVTRSSAEVGFEANDSLLLAISLLTTAFPVWWFTWFKIEKLVIATSSGELVSPTRKVFLFLLFGIGGIVAIGSLVIGLYLVFKDIFVGNFGLHSIRNARFAIALLLTTGVVFGYHWSIYRKEKSEVQVTRSKVESIILVGLNDPDMVRELSTRTGAKIVSLIRGNDGAKPWEIQELIDLIYTSDERELLIISEKEKLRIIPISENGN